MSATHWPPELEEQTDGDALQEIGFTGKGSANYAPLLAPGRVKVQSLFIPLMPACIPSPLTKQPSEAISQPVLNHWHPPTLPT